MVTSSHPMRKSPFISVGVAFACVVIAQADNISSDFPLVQTIPIAEEIYGAVLGDYIAVEGDILVLGVPHVDDVGVNAGAAIVFVRGANGLWVRTQTLYPSRITGFDNFGQAVDVSGNRIVIGAPYTDSENTNTPGAGVIYVFETSDGGTTWNETAAFSSANAIGHDHFGKALAIDGDSIVVGAPDFDIETGAAVVFDFDGQSWIEDELAIPNNRRGFRIGSEVEIDDATIVVSRQGTVLNAGAFPGRVYLYERVNGDWTLRMGWGSPDITSSVDAGNWYCEPRGMSGNGVAAIDGNLIVAGSTFDVYCENVWDDGSIQRTLTHVANAFTTFQKNAGNWRIGSHDFPDGTNMVDDDGYYGPRNTNHSWVAEIAISGGRLVTFDAQQLTLNVLQTVGDEWLHEGAIAGFSHWPFFDFDGKTLVVADQTSENILIYQIPGAERLRREFYFVSDQIDGGLNVIDPADGALVHRFDDADMPIQYSNGVTIADGNRIFVADVLGNRVVEFDGLMGSVRATYSDENIQAPVDMAFRDRDWVVGIDYNNLYVSGFNSNSAVDILGAGEQLPAGAGGLDGAAGIDFGYFENSVAGLFVCSQRADTVRAFWFYGVSQWPNCAVDGPADVLITESGGYTSSFHSDEILRGNHYGSCNVFVAAGTQGLDGPEGLAWTGFDRFAVVSKNSGQILEFDAHSGAFIREIASDMTRPTYMAVGLIDAPDCNGNDIPDSWDVLDGFSADVNGDLVPDECQGLLVGDLNCDGVVSVSDIGGFVLALTDPSGYAAQFPDCNIANADTNGDGAISVSDIGPMVALLIGG